MYEKNDKYLQSNAGHSTLSSLAFSRDEESSLSEVFTECQGKPQFPQVSFCFRKTSLGESGLWRVVWKIPACSAHGHCSAELWLLEATEM